MPITEAFVSRTLALKRDLVEKRNPYHDASGRFTSKDKAKGGGGGGGSSSPDYAKALNPPPPKPWSKMTSQERAAANGVAGARPASHSGEKKWSKMTSQERAQENARTVVQNEGMNPPPPKTKSPHVSSVEEFLNYGLSDDFRDGVADGDYGREDVLERLGDASLLQYKHVPQQHIEKITRGVENDDPEIMQHVDSWIKDTVNRGVSPSKTQEDYDREGEEIEQGNREREKVFTEHDEGDGGYLAPPKRRRRKIEGLD